MVCWCKKKFFPLTRLREKAPTMMTLFDDVILPECFTLKLVWLVKSSIITVLVLYSQLN